MLEKFGEGYNDFYFADDAIKNVKTVKHVLDQLDVKSKVQQARKLASSKLEADFNTIIEDVTGVGRFKKFSDAKARLEGISKRTRSVVAPGAQDFMG